MCLFCLTNILNAAAFITFIGMPNRRTQSDCRAVQYICLWHQHRVQKKPFWPNFRPKISHTGRCVGFMCRVKMQFTWSTPVQYRAGLRRQASNFNRSDKRSYTPTIPRRQPDEMDSTNRNIFNCKYNPNVFRFLWDLRFVLICIDWIEANSINTSNPYPFNTVADRIT